MQMMITDLPVTDFVRYGRSPNPFHKDKPEITITEIPRDYTWWDTYSEQILSFCEKVREERLHPTENPHLPVVEFKNNKYGLSQLVHRTFRRKKPKKPFIPYTRSNNSPHDDENNISSDDICPF